jgi:hypothetical protein
VQNIDQRGEFATSHWSVISGDHRTRRRRRLAPSTGIDYTLAAGPQTFAIYGREVGTILDGFVLSNINLTGAQLDAALAGVTSIGTNFSLGVTGNFTQQANSTLRFDIGAGTFADTLQVGGTASLAGKLMLNLAAGVTPLASDQFTILTAASVAGVRQLTAPASSTLGGSFQVSMRRTMKLSNFLASRRTSITTASSTPPIWSFGIRPSRTVHPPAMPTATAKPTAATSCSGSANSAAPSLAWRSPAPSPNQLL